MGARERIRGSAAFSASREVGQAALSGPGMVSSQINHNMKASITRYHETTEQDASVRTSAHYIVSNYGFGGLVLVKQMIADAMLTLMGNLLSESTGSSQATLKQVMQCTGHLDDVVRTLAKPQRQKWVSLLVKALESLRGHESHPETLTLIADLKLLWRADDDPCRTYAEAEQQLKALKKQANKNVRLALCDLLRQDGGEEALKGIREFFGSHKAELEEALECLAAQKKRQEKMIAEMERQTAQIQKKMEAPIAEEVRVGTELKERIEALQELQERLRVMEEESQKLLARISQEKKLSQQLEVSTSQNEELAKELQSREKDIEKFSEDLEVSHKEKKFMQQKEEFKQHAEKKLRAAEDKTEKAIKDAETTKKKAEADKKEAIAKADAARQAAEEQAARDAFKAKQAAEDAKAEQVRALQDAADAKKAAEKARFDGCVDGEGFRFIAGDFGDEVFPPLRDGSWAFNIAHRSAGVADLALAIATYKKSRGLQSVLIQHVAEMGSMDRMDITGLTCSLIAMHTFSLD
ncbi:hypothetical protein AK812_SmicGene2059 [Symbiodinium microadriaticum]|uniref:Uncharacterized protein n=1 Tax=Symbiodinium microadriaticum TaxID=2951 RepID=A0A1Q9F2G6_SYMMI|nr:hypothetical protein AK812_SmicGene2059 [Symbiodinium microadriaticum]